MTKFLADPESYDYLHELKKENEVLKEQNRIYKEALNAIRDGIRENTFPDLEGFGDYENLDVCCLKAISEAKKVGK